MSKSTSRATARVRSGCRTAGPARSRYANVSRWTRRAGVDVFGALDLVFVPVHRDGCHWGLGVLDMRRREVRDSVKRVL